MVNVVIGLALLVLFHAGLGWPGVQANVAAVCVSAVPAYVLCRRWVWGQSGRSSFGGEITPYLIFTVVGLVLSTMFVGWADRNYETPFVVYAANQLAFGVLWVVRYVLFDRVLWASRSRPAVRPRQLRISRDASLDDMAA